MENNYIKEFVEHYKKLGFDNICLYDNNDVNGEKFTSVINKYIKSGFVIVKNKRGVKNA
ncbi:glycosyltransferase family 92 protein [bacterium]|nr:glycosyltransferase family 92 protein [bacterium]